jgi:hypothetical protein
VRRKGELKLLEIADIEKKMLEKKTLEKRNYQISVVHDGYLVF